MLSPVPAVIMHADAFGFHPSINEGIERGYRYGLVTSTAIMAVGDALEDAVRRSYALPSLDLGLHFVLRNSRGKPLTLRAVASAWLVGELSPREAAGSLRQQLDLLQRVYKLSLSHIALDLELTLFAPLMRTVSAVAMEYQIPGVRLPQSRTPLLRQAANCSQHFVKAYGRHSTTTVLDCQGQLSPISLSGLLRGVTPGTTEIICRPGSNNRILLPLGTVEGDWERDLQAVCDASPHAYVRSGRVQLATWRDV